MTEVPRTVSADPNFRWDGDEWWNWDGRAWARLPPNSPTPRTTGYEPGNPGERTDLRSATSAMRYRGKTRRAIAALAKILDSGEFVELTLAAQSNGEAGLLALTDRRLLFVTNAAPAHCTGELQLSHAQDADVSVSKGRAVLAFRAGPSLLTASTVDASAGAALIGLVLARVSGHALTLAVTSPPARKAGIGPPPMSDNLAAADPVAAIRAVTGLRDLGLITEDEYQTKRNEILDRI